MSSHKTDQHHVIHRGRKYHFVSYEARLPNPKTATQDCRRPGS
jgi:hypothetical protein